MSHQQDPDPGDATKNNSHEDLLAVSEDYFPPLPPRPQVAPQPSTTHLSIVSGRQPPLSHRSSTASLAAKATTAISLPEGVYAQQQDGVSSGNASVTTAPSFSEGDAGSVKSMAPTMSTGEGGEEGVERMLTEILEEDAEDGILAGLGVGRAGMLPDMTEEEDSGEDMDSDVESLESRSDNDDDVPEEQRLRRFRSHRKHFFILSAAGKPIFSFHGTDSLVIPHLGAISAIISSFSTPSPSTTDTLHSFSTPTTLFTILSLPPLYLLATSTVPYETPHHLSTQLSLLHSQILSTITAPTLQSAFKNRSNFDLRRLLGGTEPILQALCRHLPNSTSHLLSNALCILHLRAAHRRALHNLLIQHRAPSLLYGLLLAPHKLIAVCRPKRHSLHPSDLQLLFNMLYNTPTFQEVGTEHWVPMCLPKFNNKGFLHVYVSFVGAGLACVLVSADREGFYELRQMREKLVDGMREAGLLGRHREVADGSVQRTKGVLEEKVHGYENPAAAYGVRHWVVKERGLVQATMPRCSTPPRRRGRQTQQKPGNSSSASPATRDAGNNHSNAGDATPVAENDPTDADASARWLPVWRRLWAEVHSPTTSGGGSAKGKTAFITVDTPSPTASAKPPRQALLHITPNYEIYAVGRRGVAGDQLVRGVREVVRWVKREEERVWVVGGATF